MRRAIAYVLVCSLLLFPVPGRASDGDGGTPSWVPWTVAGVMVLGGLLYLHKQKHHDHAAERKSPKQASLDLIAYVSTPEERAELEKLEKKDDVRLFMTRFFASRDPDPDTPENEFRDELIARYRYANANLRDHGEGWKSDAGRVFILYGPPASILPAQQIEPQGTTQPDWKYAEFWEYDLPAGNNPVPPILQDPAGFESMFRVPLPSRGRMLFIFARKSDGARLTQVYSTQAGELIDPSILQMGR